MPDDTRDPDRAPTVPGQVPLTDAELEEAGELARLVRELVESKVAEVFATHHPVHGPGQEYSPDVARGALESVRAAVRSLRGDGSQKEEEYRLLCRSVFLPGTIARSNIEINARPDVAVEAARARELLARELPRVAPRMADASVQKLHTDAVDAWAQRLPASKVLERIHVFVGAVVPVGDFKRWQDHWQTHWWWPRPDGPPRARKPKRERPTP